VLNADQSVSMDTRTIEGAVEAALSTASVKFEVRLVGATKRDDWECDAWRVIFSKPGGPVAEFDYFTGIGHRKAPREKAQWEKENAKPVKPHAASVLHSLVSDAGALDSCFADWCADFGYSDDSLKALDTYRACCDNGKKLQSIFGRDGMRKLGELLQDY
jgi:hypothetical protein